MDKAFNFFISKIKSYFFNENVPMEQKNFFLALLYAVVADSILLVCYISFNYNAATIIICMGLLVSCIGMAFIAMSYNEYQLMTYLFCVIINLVVYPLLFFTTGDLYNGVCIFFATGVIISLFLTSGLFAVAVSAIELIWYTFILVFAYQNQSYLEQYRYATVSQSAIYVNFSVAALIPILIMAYQSTIYEKLRVTEEKSSFSIKNAESGKTRFLANMTHEFRNPMNAIVGMNELILEENLPAASKENSEMVRESANQLLKIVNNILVYSKLESGKWEIVENKYSFFNVIKEIINSFSYKAYNEQFDMFFYVDKNIPKSTYGDAFSIKQVFAYLLFNSLQQKERRSMSVEIRCMKDISNHTVKFICRIAESGQGIPEDDIESILGAYTKYDSRQSSSLKGMGLEISICSEILSQMGGSLKLESVMGVGIAISFEFINYILEEAPMIEIDEKVIHKTVLIYLHKREDEKVWRPLMENLEMSPDYVMGTTAFKDAIENKRNTHIFIKDSDYESVKDILSVSGCDDITYVITDVVRVYGDFGKCKILRSPISSINISEALNNKWNESEYVSVKDIRKIIFPKARIILVEDSPVNQKVMKDLLEQYKVKVDIASSGKRCLELMSMENYDLVFISQNLQDMGSSVVLHAIKRLSEKAARVPILCVTSEIGRDVGKHLAEIGFNDYLAIPIKTFHLERLLKKYIPLELIEYEIEQSKKSMPMQSAENVNPDPLEISFDNGIANVGGSREIYFSILKTYYDEGLVKQVDIVKESLDNDLSLFTTDVHALKSSSMAVGALGISAYFRALEFAGKENDVEYISRNLSEIINNFIIVLERVKEYLESNGVDLITEAETNENSGEVNLLDVSKVEELYSYISSFNLKSCEETIAEISSVNYDSEINAYIKDIKKNFEIFEYFKAKEIIEELLKVMKK